MDIRMFGKVDNGSACFVRVACARMVVGIENKEKFPSQLSESRTWLSDRGATAEPLFTKASVRQRKLTTTTTTTTVPVRRGWKAEFWKELMRPRACSRSIRNGSTGDSRLTGFPFSRTGSLRPPRISVIPVHPRHHHLLCAFPFCVTKPPCITLRFVTTFLDL